MSNAAAGSRVFYLGSDEGLMADLAAHVQSRAVELVRLKRVSELIEQVARSTPEVVILETAQAMEKGELPTLLEALAGEDGYRPAVICIGGQDSGVDAMQQRLEVLRAGAASYLAPPVVARRLAARVLRMCGAVETSRYRILILEPDSAQAKQTASLLAASGMETLVVDDPMKILARMQVFRPNLVLMDLYPPGATGAELTAIIRDHDDFYGIPILFLSSEPDLDKQLAALKAGGDGFIKKPVSRDALICAVEHRMRLSRWLQDRRTLVNRRETARGFLPRDVFMRHLEQLTGGLGAGLGGVNGLLLIDIDRAQALLSALGLTATERLLRALESQLSRTLGQDESATRMDDFRYALLARRESVTGLEALAGTLSRQLSGLDPGDSEGKLKLTVSIGVGLFDPPLEDVPALAARAEKALAAAVSAGGNQVRLWSRPGKGGAAEAASVIKRLVSAALAQDGFLLLFQPILALEQKDDELYEALIRMKTLDGEEIPPAEFLSVAERAEMTSRIDRWVLRRALEVMRAERKTHPRLRLLVHQSVTTLAAPQWFPWLREQIAGDGSAQTYPVLEFQMADVRQNRAEAKLLIERLRKYGIQVCVANVTGIREEISLLRRIGASLAKLAFHTIRNADRAGLTELIQALRARGVAVIAPGIDDQATVARVWTCRPDFIQGNYLQLPQPDLSFDFRRTSHER